MILIINSLNISYYLTNKILKLDYSKLDRLIDQAINYETDDYITNINLKPEVSDKLYQYQYRHVFNLMASFRNNKIIMDGSDTGTGKTYTAIALCKQLRLRPLIICPKSIISNWHSVCKIFQVKPLTVVNYELIKNGKQYDNAGNRIDSPFLELNNNLPDEKIFKWKLPRNSVVIFDEVHVCKNNKTINGKLLRSTKSLYKVLLISATISDKPTSFNVFGYMLGFYNSMRKANNWIKGMLREDKCKIGGPPKISSINKAIYPDRGSRMRIVELGKSFPDNQVNAICYTLDPDDEKEVNSAFDTIKLGTIKIKSGILDELDNKNVLTEITKARMSIELKKIPIFEELISNYIENGFVVVVFVNFRKTLLQLAKIFKTESIVHGGQTMAERDAVVDNFQKNRTNIILCTIGSGSLGLSLHDLYGVPRVSLISPTFKSISLQQALGRIYRAGSKSPALQRIIYCSNTCEESICHIVNEKLKFTSKINDNDLVQII